MTPFSYPKSAHVRRLKPGPFTTYQKYKPFLRDEFEKKCVYCRMPDTMKDPQMYGADHYRPKSVFPQLATKYENLFYCCNPCNQRKRDYWPTWRKVKTHFIPNPCDHAISRTSGSSRSGWSRARQPAGSLTSSWTSMAPTSCSTGVSS